MSSPASAAPAAAVAATAAGHTAILDAAVHSAGSAQADQAAAATTTARTHHAAALPRTYKVRAGDSLTSIASHLYHESAAWPALYWRNQHRIKWADEIYAGQVLRVPAKPRHIPAAPKQTGPAVALRTPTDAVSPSQPVTAPTAADPAPAAAADVSGGYPGGAFGACVVARESGGNPQVMNATGHYGLYQFSEATWVAYGGNAADFGHASVAEQNQVFATALAEGGQDNWAPYDGC